MDLHARGRARALVSFDWLVFDELYGRNEDFLAELEQRKQLYVGEVPVSTTVWTVDPATQVPEYSGRGRHPTRPLRDSVRSVKEVAETLPAASWQVRCLRAGSGEPVAFEFAAVRVWARRAQEPGPPIWLLIRRPVGGEGEVKYYVSNAPEQTPLAVLALVSGCRMRVEEYFEDGKGYLGMGPYEGRSWVGWHHHMTLVALAHLLVTGGGPAATQKKERADTGHCGAALEGSTCRDRS